MDLDRTDERAPALPNLSGAWVNYQQNAVYYLRHLEDDGIWWAGLHSDGFHPGVAFSNVFHGALDRRTRTIEGSWADVPRGRNLGHGRLRLDVVDEATPDSYPPPTDRFGRPLPRPARVISLRLRPDGTTGGFGGGVWTRWFSLYPQDINDLMHRVWRYDNRLDAEHPPYKDFGVVTGRIGPNGASLNWTPESRDYCSFITGQGRGQCGDGDCDGDITFRLELNGAERQLLDCQRGFWTAGWLTRLDFFAAFHLDRPWGDILNILNRSGGFEAEAGMFGRENQWFDCGAEPRILLPGWMEHGGNSVLVNGLPVNENAFREDGVTVVLFTPEIAGEQYRLVFQPGARIRVTGVVTIDSGHYGHPWYESAPELHPFYSVDFLQDFALAREDASLTGVWQADDVGTYYVRQVDDGTVWWLGMSSDQGRTFANVFHGQVDDGAISGPWVDVPMGVGGVRSQGWLVLTDAGGGGDLTTALSAVERTGGFSATGWTKLYDRPLPPPDHLG